MTSHIQGEDDRSSLEAIIDNYATDDDAANAPEIDNAFFAPEYRGDNDPPEVRPESGVQTFYESSPPEVTVVESSTTVKDLANDTHITPSNRLRKIFMLAIAVLALTVIALGVGLGLALKRREITDSPLESSETPSVKQNGILHDTSIAAITLPNGNRKVFFQGANGAIREAVYSSRAKIWQAFAKSEVVSRARGNTPLAVTRLETHENELYLFYVNPDHDTLSCALWQGGSMLDGHFSPVRDLHNATVACDSRKMSATIVSATSNQSGLLLVYENPSHQLNFMYGKAQKQIRSIAGDFVAGGFGLPVANEEYIYTLWTWHNVTNAIHSTVATETYGEPGIVAGTCSVIKASSQLFCFSSRRGSNPNTEIEGLVKIDFLISPSGDLVFRAISYSEPGSNSEFSSDIAPLAGGTIMYFNHTSLQFDGAIPPSPTSPFPFRRLASTFKQNSTESYVYHQLNDSVLTEEFWDGDSTGLCIAQGIPIDTA